MRVVALTLLLQSVCFGDLVLDVRNTIARDDFATAEKLIANDRMQRGTNPEMLEAYSWLGRGALMMKRFDQADRYAAETRRMCIEALKKRPVDAEAHLPLALGAAIEVQANVLVARGQRTEAVALLKKELVTWHNTSIRTRIQKNINLLSLVGTTPPPLELKAYVGQKPPPLETLKGKAVLLFFWAHWCPDCKSESGILAQLRDRYASKGLLLIGPTQYYGYAAGGEDATPDKEKAHIERVRHEFYPGLMEMPVPLSEENFKNYGASSTPTLVLLDRKGVVRMYHPGKMTYEELADAIDKVL